MDKYFDEAEDTLTRAIKENHAVDTAAIELNALKMAYNISFHDLREACIPVIVKNVKLDNADQAQRVLTKWGALIRRFGTSLNDQIDILNIALNACRGSPSASKLFMKVITTWYQEDVVEEEPIVKWCHDDAQWDRIAAELKPIRKNVSEFVEWLENAETEESSDGEE
jgi:hypothetical protein